MGSQDKKQLKVYIDHDMLHKFRVMCAQKEISMSECVKRKIKEEIEAQKSGKSDSD